MALQMIARTFYCQFIMTWTSDLELYTSVSAIDRTRPLYFLLTIVIQERATFRTFPPIGRDFIYRYVIRWERILRNKIHCVGDDLYLTRSHVAFTRRRKNAKQPRVWDVST